MPLNCLPFLQAFFKLLANFNEIKTQQSQLIHSSVIIGKGKGQTQQMHFQKLAKRELAHFALAQKIITPYSPNTHLRTFPPSTVGGKQFIHSIISFILDWAKIIGLSWGICPSPPPI
jgi:hypothetical protein